jgi:CYTH domain-containing protein
MNAVSGQAGKYARFELERRFLVSRLPKGIVEDRSSRISDRYIQNTQLRLRRMEPLDGGEAIFKLGRKDVPSPPDFSRMTITNIYLSGGEYAVLAKLQALELHKVRHQIEHGDHIFSVDVSMPAWPASFSPRSASRPPRRWIGHLISHLG